MRMRLNTRTTAFFRNRRATVFGVSGGTARDSVGPWACSSSSKYHSACLPTTRSPSSLRSARAAATLSYAALGSTFAPREAGPPGHRGLIQGLPGAPGVTIGNIVLPSRLAELDSVANRAPEDAGREEAIFRRAVRETQEEVRASADRMEGRLSAETRAIFDVYILILGQDDLVEDVVARIRKGNWAPGALPDRMLSTPSCSAGKDPYLQTRAEDIRAIGHRILRAAAKVTRSRSIRARRYFSVTRSVSPASRTCHRDSSKASYACAAPWSRIRLFSPVNSEYRQ